MRVKIREMAVLLALTAWVSVLPQAASAWTPARPVDVVVHTGPGGGSDIFARAIADLMQKEGLVPQRLQVVNKSGGGGVYTPNMFNSLIAPLLMWVVLAPGVPPQSGAHENVKTIKAERVKERIELDGRLDGGLARPSTSSGPRAA